MGGCSNNCNEGRCGIEDGNNQVNKLRTRLKPPSIIPPTSFVTAKADSGASKHYWRPQDVTSLKNITSDPFGPCVKLPDNSLIRATHTGQEVNQHSYKQKDTNNKLVHIIMMVHLVGTFTTTGTCTGNNTKT